jgi:hypothetical protein
MGDPIRYPDNQWGVFGLALADLNRDGAVDVIATSYHFNDLSAVVVLLGNGNGTLQPPRHFDVPQTPAPGLDLARAVVAADFDRDERVDVIVAVNEASMLYYYKGDGAGGLAPASAIAAGARVRGLAAADLDGDGALDLVTTNDRFTLGNDGAVGVLPGRGDGTFEAATLWPASADPGVPSVGDVDNDGRPDVVVPDETQSRVFVFLTGADGTLAAGPVIGTTGTGIVLRGLTIADYDRDGRQDILIEGDGRLAVMKGDGAGGFTALPTQTSAQGGGRHVRRTATDLDGDGDPDVLLAGNSSGQEYSDNVVSVGLNDGTGRFTFTHWIAADVAAGYTGIGDADPDMAVPADMNGDGRLDLVVGLGNRNTFRPGGISVILATAGGAYRTGRMAAFSQTWYRYVAALADIDRDGRPEIVARTHEPPYLHVARGQASGLPTRRQPSATRTPR